MKKILTVLSVAAFAACGSSNPKNYVGAVDFSTFQQLPATCFPSAEPADTDTITATDQNFPIDFSVWQSADGKSTILEANNNLSQLFTIVTAGTGSGAGAIAFGAAASATMSSTDGKTFTSGEVHKSGTTDTITDTITVTITFTDTSYTKGTLTASASRVTAGPDVTAADFAFNCAPPALSFIARAVDGNNVVNYDESLRTGTNN